MFVTAVRERTKILKASHTMPARKSANKSKTSSKSSKNNALYNKWRYTSRTGSFKSQLLVFIILGVGFMGLRRRRQAQIQKLLQEQNDYTLWKISLTLFNKKKQTNINKL